MEGGWWETLVWDVTIIFNWTRVCAAGTPYIGRGNRSLKKERKTDWNCFVLTRAIGLWGFPDAMVYFLAVFNTQRGRCEVSWIKC